MTRSDKLPTIRDGTRADLEAVLALNNANEPNVDATTLEEMEWYFEHSAAFRVAVLEGRLAGFLVALAPGLDYRSLNYRWFSAAYDNFVYVDRIVVAEFARNAGLGGRFYGELVEFTRARAPVILLEVNIRPRNDGSLRFHNRFGFRVVGQQETGGGKKEVALMEMPVEGPGPLA